MPDPGEVLRRAGARGVIGADMGDVRRRAERYRRRRRAGAAALVAVAPALVAVAVVSSLVSDPTPALDGRRPDRAPAAPAPVPSTPAPETVPPPEGPATPSRPAPTGGAPHALEPPSPTPRLSPAPPALLPPSTAPQPSDAVQGAPTAPVVPPHRVQFEAEDALLAPPLRVVRDDQAFGGAYVVSQGAAGGDVPGVVEFAFDVPHRATYRIAAYMQGPSPSANSFSASVDGQPERYVIAPGDDDGRWRWQAVTSAGTPGPALFDLAAGRHVLRVIDREPGARLDRVLVTTEPAPGGPSAGP